MKQFSRHKIEAQLQRILESEDFQRSQRISSFLKYIVQRTLDNEKDGISGYSIGVDVFSKPEGFNADNDSSVRVEAVRLRKALELYYHTTGKGDPIVIKVPKGGYVPFFIEGAEKGVNEPESFVSQHERKKKQVWMAGFFAAICVLFVGVVFITTISELHVDELEQPIIAIEPFSAFGFEEPDEIKASAAYIFNRRFSHFTHLRNIAIEQQEGLETLRGNAAHEKFHYLLEGKIERAGSIMRIKVRLFDTRQATSVWSDMKIYAVEDEADIEWLKDAAGRIVSQLASMHGVIDTLEYSKFHQEKAEKGKDYKCLLSFRMYDNNKSMERHHKIRECLERLVKEDPNNSLGWAYLSWMYGDEVRQAYNLRKDGYEGAIKRALQAGINAVQADQDNALSHAYLSTAAMLSGNEDLTRRHINLSVDLNPYDTMILILAAWKLMNLGDWERGKEYAERAHNLHPSPPAGFDGSLFIYHYHKGDYQKALSYAMGYYRPDLFTSNLALIAAYQRSKKFKEAKDLAQIVNEQYPQQLQKFYPLLEVWRPHKDFRIKFIEDLKKAGVNLPKE